ncbi:DUF572-domain-containing protein [Boletus reticuloceps]|uniref:Splicing factor YJU2 n=1 Tax=Boletus reticuloceps TaxID=495285 RepID=A0A8I3AEA6_9AGAM|nr:DUF572-domain-containing protein [Boletus reticuloceps]
MSERKVLNKYFPPDFDPSLIPRRRGPKNSQQVVRLMAPFSMRCNTCGEYIYKGKKFNARKETVDGEDYYGIKIFRFYIKCTLCSAEITFKTDPKNTDYTAEHGASRNFEPWRDEKQVEEDDRLARLEEEENNPMKALENRTVDAKREMDILDALQDIQDLETEEDQRRREEEEADEKLVREVFSKVSMPAPPAGQSSSSQPEASTSQPVTLKRKAGEIEPDLYSLLPESTRELIDSKATTSVAPLAKKSKPDLKSKLGIKVAKKGKVAV